MSQCRKTLRSNEAGLPGWTLSETLVMMIVSGIVFVSVMEGITLFNRLTDLHTRRIAGNMRLWQGYYLLCDLTSSADSVLTHGTGVQLLRGGETAAELFEADSMLVARHGSRTDTLIGGVSGLRVAGTLHRAGTDTLLLAVHGGAGGVLTLSFPVAPPAHELLIDELERQERQYSYE